MVGRVWKKLGGGSPTTGFVFALAGLALVALLVRLHGIADRDLFHPENFAPGLMVPDWVRFPPRRDTLGAILRGTLIDGHPPTYFVGLFAWIQLVGASLTAIRLPSALLGGASVFLLGRVVLREDGMRVALLAAALLALHGFHVYWSQVARMYVPASFLGLASTLLLFRLRERERTTELLLYAAVTALGLWTQLYAWPLVLAQGLVVVAWSTRGLCGARLFDALVLAVVASTPIVQLAVFQNPPSRWHEPALEYWEFGHLFAASTPYFGPAPELPVARWLLVAVCTTLLALGVLWKTDAVPGQAPESRRPSLRAPTWALASAMAAGMLAFALFGPERERVSEGALLACAFLPLALTAAAPRARDLAVLLAGRLPPRVLAVPAVALLGIVPMLCMEGVSLVRGVFVSRGTVVFLPYLLATVALGLEQLGRVRWIRLAATTAVVSVFAASVAHFSTAVGSPRDYSGIAREILGHVGPHDRILVRNDFIYPPLIYYLREVEPQLVHEEFVRVVAGMPPTARVWTVRFDGQQDERPEVAQALAGLRAGARIYCHGGIVTPYARAE